MCNEQHTIRIDWDTRHVGQSEDNSSVILPNCHCEYKCIYVYVPKPNPALNQQHIINPIIYQTTRQYIGAYITLLKLS